MEGDVLGYPGISVRSISIHSLRMEGDTLTIMYFVSKMISIHSLRMEGDLEPHHKCRQDQYFNPLPPYGGRLYGNLYNRVRKLFQSTPSVWRETGFSFTNILIMCNFNPLPPYGGRRNISSRPAVRLYFNPLPPYGGRRWLFLAFSVMIEISIHSLRMEGDSSLRSTIIPSFHFNPLPPYGGRPVRF